MNAANLRQALTQTLESFKRCGVARFGADKELSPELGGKLEEWFANEHSALTPAPQVSEQLAPASTTQSAANSQSRDNVHSEAATQPQDSSQTHAAAVAATETRPNPNLLSPSSGPWTLPVLNIEERQREFATLDEKIKACRRCPNIVDFRQQTVFGVGELKPRLCFIGEAPGADEDRLGEPFVGRAGQLLNKIIGAMKLRREEVYILNALKCRPPQNRTPLPEEIANCNEFVERQLEVLQPEYIVCLGAVAVRALLGSSSSIGRLRGRFHEYKSARVVVTYHPSYLLRQESAKRMVWEDMKMLLADMGVAI